MASTITHTQTRSLETGGYQVVDTVTASTNIPLEPFVFTVSTELFNRVATVYDMDTYPNTRAAAVTAGLDYYRLAEVTALWPDLDEAREFADGLAERLKSLVVEYAAAIVLFEGTTTTTVTS